MDKIKTDDSSKYKQSIDINAENLDDALKLELIEKINEIIDWINSQ